MAFVVETDIARPPELAFDRMADARHETEWNSRVSRSELVSGEPIGRGTRFLTVNRGQEYAATLTTYERPGRLVFEVTGSQMDITATFEFRAAGTGTAYVGTFDMRPKGFVKRLFPLMTPMVRHDLDKQSQRFKAFCESA